MFSYKTCSQQQKTIEPAVLVHGGAGSFPDAIVPCKNFGVRLAARTGYETLLSTGYVLDAVQSAICSMELDEHFNAGYGCVLTWEGKAEMDAAIMNGADLEAGCVSLARNIVHPIKLARCIMQKTPHRYLVGEGAMNFAIEEGFEVLDDDAFIRPSTLKALEHYRKFISEKSKLKESVAKCELETENPAIFGGENKSPIDFNESKPSIILPTRSNENNFTKPKPSIVGASKSGEKGTVGAVAIDAYGNVAAATSTAGYTGKMPGRIGDSPILGGGTYADNVSGCISCSGHGETIMRYRAASRVLALIEMCGMPAQQACSKVLSEMTERFNEPAGTIAIDFRGNLGIFFTTERMSWAYQRGGEVHYGMDVGEDIVELATDPKINLCQLECLEENNKTMENSKFIEPFIDFQ